MRNMSFAMTTPQMVAHTKTVTRRIGWQFLKPGDMVRAVKKGMGLKKGEKIEVLGHIRIVSVRQERLADISPEECRREGFPEMWPRDFVNMLCTHYKITPDTFFNRIEFEHVTEDGDYGQRL